MKLQIIHFFKLILVKLSSGEVWQSGRQRKRIVRKRSLFFSETKKMKSSRFRQISITINAKRLIVQVISKKNKTKLKKKVMTTLWAPLFSLPQPGHENSRTVRSSYYLLVYTLWIGFLFSFVILLVAAVTFAERCYHFSRSQTKTFLLFFRLVSVF